MPKEKEEYTTIRIRVDTVTKLKKLASEYSDKHGVNLAIGQIGDLCIEDCIEAIETGKAVIPRVVTIVKALRRREKEKGDQPDIAFGGGIRLDDEEQSEQKGRKKA